MTTYVVVYDKKNVTSQGGSTVSISLAPTNGILYGNPGDTVGWGFDLTTDANYGFVVEQSNFCPLTVARGDAQYTDLIAYPNGIFDNPGDATREEDYVGGMNPAGFGNYVVQSTPTAGYLQLEYYLTSDSMGDPVPNSDQTIYVAAEATPTPEPGSLLMVVGAARLLAVWRRLR